jgi:hypothetical protein
MNNDQINKIREYYAKTEKSPFVFNMYTGEVSHDTKLFYTEKSAWRFVTDDWYPVYEGEQYVTWYPYGIEDQTWNVGEMIKI